MSQQLSPLALAGVTQRLAEVRERIARAAERSGRDPARCAVREGVCLPGSWNAARPPMLARKIQDFLVRLTSRLSPGLSWSV